MNARKLKELEESVRQLLKLPDFGVSYSQASSGVLVLAGPSGCGKSSALAVLAQQLGAELLEWRELGELPRALTSCVLS